MPLKRRAAPHGADEDHSALSALRSLRGAKRPGCGPGPGQIGLNIRAQAWRGAGKARPLLKQWRDDMYFKRNARPKLPADLRGLSRDEATAAVDALSYPEFNLMLTDQHDREIVKKQKLHHRCLDRRCRRARTCTAGKSCCVGFDVADVGRRGAQAHRRTQAATLDQVLGIVDAISAFTRVFDALWPIRSARGSLTPSRPPSKTRNVLGKQPRKPPEKAQ